MFLILRQSFLVFRPVSIRSNTLSLTYVPSQGLKNVYGWSNFYCIFLFLFPCGHGTFLPAIPEVVKLNITSCRRHKSGTYSASSIKAKYSNWFHQRECCKLYYLQLNRVTGFRGNNLLEDKYLYGFWCRVRSTKDYQYLWFCSPESLLFSFVSK